jgi:hypothetical protein
MACPDSDGLGGVYSEKGRDTKLSAKAREGALNLALAYSHLSNEEPEDALQSADEALGTFRELKDDDAVADTIRLKVHVLCFQDKRKDAHALAKAELERIRSGSDRTGEAKMLLSIADANAEKRGQKKREEALMSATQAQVLFKEKGDKRMEAHAMLVLLNIAVKTNAQRALSMGAEALELFKEIGDKRGEAHALHGLAAALIKAKATGAAPAETARFKSWQDAAKGAADIFKDLNLKKLLAFEKICIAQWYLEENPRKALRNAEEALKLCQSIDSKQEPAALAIVVQAHLSIKDTSKAWMLKEAALAVKKAKAGIERFRIAGDIVGEGYALNALVLALLAKEEHDAALTAAGDACIAFRKAGDRPSEIMMLQLIAQLHLKGAKPEKAMQAAQDVTSMSNSLVDQVLALEAIYEVYISKKDFQAALTTAKEMKQLCFSAGDKKREAVTLLLSSNAHYMQGEFMDAVGTAREAQALLHDLEESKEEANALRIVAEAHAANREPEAALRAAERARTILEQFGDSDTLATTLFLCAQLRLLALVAAGEMMSSDMQTSATFLAGWGEAASTADEAVALARKLKKTRLTASCLCTVAQVQLANLKVEPAIKAANEAMAIFRAAGDERNEACVMCIEADIQLIKGSVKRALGLVNKAIAIFKQHKDARGEWVALGVLEHITGPPEPEQMEIEYYDEQPQYEEQQQEYTQEEWAAWMASQQQGQQSQQQAQDPSALAKAPREARELDMANKLNVNAMNKDIVQNRITEIMKVVVDIDEDDEFSLDTPLMQVGVTSKTAVVLRNALSEEVPGMSMPFTLIFDYPSVSAIADLVMDSVK